MSVGELWVLDPGMQELVYAEPEFVAGVISGCVYFVSDLVFSTVSVDVWVWNGSLWGSGPDDGGRA